MAHYRSIFISDLHLGARGVQAEAVVNFLNLNTCDHLYLVGDIIDFWALSRKSYFPVSHRAVLQRITFLASHGTKVTYIPGNHDEAFRMFLPVTFDGVKFVNEVEHVTAAGKRYLVIHGDQFDHVMENMRWLAYIGDVAYSLSLRMNCSINRLRASLGLPRWSFSAYMKHRVKSAVNFISNFEETLALAAKERNCDGVICGHIHTAVDREIAGVHYLNTGDWVESCTALVETADGRLSIETFDVSTPSYLAPVVPFRRAA
jgi:UDP-2,3-diacylglucosamine pyrophosphatase LpxH